MENLKLISEKNNKSLKRREIVFNIDATSAPSKKDVAEFVAKKYSSTPEAVHIKTIKGKFGQQCFKVDVQVYASKEDKIKTVIKTQKQVAAEKKAIDDAAKAGAQ